jgi:cytidylate kinase
VIVAIDGPAGAGKSTVARALARRLGAAYLDTGAMYRALAWLALRDGVADSDERALAALAEGNPVTLRQDGEVLRVAIAGRDVTDAIREPEVSAATSRVSAHPAVRAAMVAAQRRLLGGGGSWVGDGRDVGSVVWPGAELKVFLTADPEVRARRRLGDLAARGTRTTLGEVLDDLRERDHRDSSRAESPLVVAEGAVRVDTSGMSFDDVVDTLAGLAARAAAGAAR